MTLSTVLRIMQFEEANTGLLCKIACIFVQVKNARASTRKIWKRMWCLRASRKDLFRRQ